MGELQSGCQYASEIPLLSSSSPNSQCSVIGIVEGKYL